MEASDCIESVAESAPSAEEFSRQRRRMTLPERLCFLLDTGPEMAAVWEEGEQRLDAMKMAIKLIIRRKVNLNPKHQYALATFDGNGSLNHVCEFTSSVSEIDTALERVKQSTSPESPVDLSHLVDSLQQKVFHSAAESAVENSLCRCVLVFGRSSTIPEYTWEPELLSKPTFLLDILYVHHRSSEPSVLCQEIFDILCELQHEEPAGSSRCGKTAYVMESHSSPLKFLPAVAAMLSHPVQRGELYGDGGLLERLDPSEAFIAEIRERVLAASVAVTPDHRASSTASNSKVHESRNNQGSSSAKNIANSSNISNNSSSGSGDTFSNKVKHSAWSLFSGKK